MLRFFIIAILFTVTLSTMSHFLSFESAVISGISILIANDYKEE